MGVAVGEVPPSRVAMLIVVVASRENSAAVDDGNRVVVARHNSDDVTPFGDILDTRSSVARGKYKSTHLQSTFSGATRQR